MIKVAIDDQSNYLETNTVILNSSNEISLLKVCSGSGQSIHKSRGGVSLVEQDTIGYVSWPI